MTQHGGLALSYLNLYDADAAWLLVHDLAARFGRPAAAIIKHANPCGAAVAGTLADAYQRAFECDERSAFGGIVAVSGAVDEATVERMVAAAQADVVIAPGYAPGAVEALAAKRKNTRLLEAAPPDARPPGTCARSPAACWCRTRTGFVAAAGRLAGGDRSASPPRPRWPTPSWPGGCAAG